MRNSKMKYFSICLLLISVNLVADEKPKDPVKWSQYQGKKTWQEAKEHCQTMKMRLPTISELKLANDAGTSLGWRKNGSRYWAVNKNLDSDNSTYKAISLMVEGEEVHKGESQLGVFCANVTEESSTLDRIRDLEENKASASEIQELKIQYYSKQFSDYQGDLTWDDANKKCKSLKMRLPKIYELKEAYESKIMNSWKKDGYFYWSSTPYDAERYYGLDVGDGSTSYNDRNINHRVRCRR